MAARWFAPNSASDALGKGSHIELHPPNRPRARIVSLLAPPTEAAGLRKYCEPQVSERLDLLKVDPSDIREITYDAQYSGRDNNRLVRLLAWVGLHSCKGYVIVDLSKLCTVREVYGRDECNLGDTLKPW